MNVLDHVDLLVVVFTAFHWVDSLPALRDLLALRRQIRGAHHRLLHLPHHPQPNVGEWLYPARQNATPSLFFLADVVATHGALTEFPFDNFHLANPAAPTPTADRNAFSTQGLHAQEQRLGVAALVLLMGIQDEDFEGHLILISILLFNLEIIFHFGKNVNNQGIP